MHRRWMPAVDVGVIGAKSCDLELKIVFQDNNYAEVRADRVCARKKFLHRFRRLVRRDVVVFWCQPANHVTHATPGEIADVTCVAQTRRHLTRSFFHRRWFHANTVAASLCEAQRRHYNVTGVSLPANSE